MGGALPDIEALLRRDAVIRTERLILRPFTVGDEGDVWAWASDPEVAEYLTWHPHADRETTRSVMEEHLMKPGVWAIELNAEDRCVGCLDLRPDPENGKASFGYVMNRSYWGRGIMTETLGAVIGYCFSVLGLNRIEATHDARNEKSGRVMAKCGMEREGLARQEARVKGRFVDRVHYGLTRDRWEGRRPGA